jgi:hypothetical protein
LGSRFVYGRVEKERGYSLVLSLPTERLTQKGLREIDDENTSTTIEIE